MSVSFKEINQKYQSLLAKNDANALKIKQILFQFKQKAASFAVKKFGMEMNLCKIIFNSTFNKAFKELTNGLTTHINKEQWIKNQTGQSVGNLKKRIKPIVLNFDSLSAEIQSQPIWENEKKDPKQAVNDVCLTVLGSFNNSDSRLKWCSAVSNRAKYDEKQSKLQKLSVELNKHEAKLKAIKQKIKKLKKENKDTQKEVKNEKFVKSSVQETKNRIRAAKKTLKNVQKKVVADMDLMLVRLGEIVVWADYSKRLLIDDGIGLNLLPFFEKYAAEIYAEIIRERPSLAEDGDEVSEEVKQYGIVKETQILIGQELQEIFINHFSLGVKLGQNLVNNKNIVSGADSQLELRGEPLEPPFFYLNEKRVKETYASRLYDMNKVFQFVKNEKKYDIEIQNMSKNVDGSISIDVEMNKMDISMESESDDANLLSSDSE